MTQSDAGLSRRVSIHAPLRGATAPLYKLDSGFYRFNPRTPAGCDSSLIRPCTCGDLFQSTHPCGVRHRLGPMCDMHRGRFNPRTPAGCDSHLLKLGISPLEFQSTHPCGVRLRQARSWWRHFRFNPRTPAGCDCATANFPCKYACFNPRTPAGCDLYPLSSILLRLRFNPRTPAGCDLPLCLGTLAPAMFQSTHPCGVRQYARYLLASADKFQSTHPCGVRPALLLPTGCRHSVSIHAPLRGATQAVLYLFEAAHCFNPRTPAGCDT